jgi:mono/diheme cytochrome c family protein
MASILDNLAASCNLESEGRLRNFWIVVAAAVISLFIAGCDSGPPPAKSDAELHLTEQQARGRRLFSQSCAQCHRAYSDDQLNGPSLQGVFKRQALPSGIPANDDRVRETIELGRAKMPSFRNLFSDDQVDDLIAYLHTL